MAGTEAGHDCACDSYIARIRIPRGTTSNPIAARDVIVTVGTYERGIVMLVWSQSARAGDPRFESLHAEFVVRPADSPELLRQAYRLRYQVYCVENAFEDPAQHPDGLETDEFDDNALHILPQPDTRLPFARLCADPIRHDRNRLPPARTAEVSRFALSKTLRRTVARWMDATSDARRDALLVRELVIALIHAILATCAEQGITHLVAVMEPALLRLLSRFGILFAPIGPLVDYHGMRQPCAAVVDTLERQMHARLPNLFDLIPNPTKLRAAG